jgi:SAM-dependent methyltransferase
MDSKEYWDNKIIEWEDSLQGSAKVSFIESLAAHFREPLKVRRQLCFDLLKKIGKGKTILELGCGSGFFATKAFQEIKPKKMIGLDISQNAIQRANALKKSLKISSKKLEFIEADTTVLRKLPKTDITIGLGFLDYLSASEISTLMRSLKSTYIIFTFSEKKASLMRYLHMLYLVSQNCPKHYYYTKEEIVRFVKERYKKVTIISGKKLMFGCIVHNIS